MGEMRNTADSTETEAEACSPNCTGDRASGWDWLHSILQGRNLFPLSYNALHLTAERLPARVGDYLRRAN